MTQYLVEAAVGKLNEILLGGNIKEHIVANYPLIGTLRQCLKSNPDLIYNLVEIGDNADDFNSFMQKEDQPTAEHSLEVAEICEGMVPHLGGINREKLIKAAKYHDVGKLWIPDEIKHKEVKGLGDIEPFELIFLKYGHVLCGQTWAEIAELEDYLVKAAGFHHDKRNEYGYPHKVFELPDETKALQVANDAWDEYHRVIKVADFAQAMKDPSRKASAWHKKNGTDFSQDIDKQVFRNLVRGIHDNSFEQPYVEAYLKSRGLGDSDIAELHKEVLEE